MLRSASGDISKMRLILGHGALYEEKPNGIRCSPVPKERWLREPFICVDKCEEVRPDVVWDLLMYPWPFKDGAFEQVVDTTGLGLVYEAQTLRFQSEVSRVLVVGGTFVGRGREGLTIV